MSFQRLPVDPQCIFGFSVFAAPQLGWLFVFLSKSVDSIEMEDNNRDEGLLHLKIRMFELTIDYQH